MATIWDKSHAGRLTVTTPMGTLFTVRHQNGKCKAHIRWNKDVGANLTRAMGTGRGKLMQRIIRDTHPLVPFDTGMLDNSAQLAPTTTPARSSGLRPMQDLSIICTPRARACTVTPACAAATGPSAARTPTKSHGTSSGKQ